MVCRLSLPIRMYPSFSMISIPKENAVDPSLFERLFGNESTDKSGYFLCGTTSGKIYASRAIQCDLRQANALPFLDQEGAIVFLSYASMQSTSRKRRNSFDSLILVSQSGRVTLVTYGNSGNETVEPSLYCASVPDRPVSARLFEDVIVLKCESKNFYALSLLGLLHGSLADWLRLCPNDEEDPLECLCLDGVLGIVAATESPARLIATAPMLTSETSRLLAAPESIFDANEIVRLSTIRECEMLLENRMTKALFLAARSRELEEVSRDLDQLSRLQRERALKFTVLPCEIPFIAHNNSRVPAVVRVLITSTADFDLSDGWSVQLLLRAPQGKSQLPAPFQVVSQPIWHVSPTSWWETSVDLDLALFPHFVIAELSLVRRSTAGSVGPESFLSVVAKTVQLSMLDFVVPCPRQYRSVQGQLRAASSSELATQSLRFKVSPTRDFQRAVLAHLLCTKFSQKERLSQILVTSSLGFLMFPGYTQFATVSFHCAEQNVAENVASRETAIPAEIRIRSISEKLATKLAIMLALRVVEVQHEGSDLAGISMGWLDLVDLPALRAGISEFVLTIE